MTALEFILKDYNGEITKDELDKDWLGIPPSVDEICDLMKRFAELQIRAGVKWYDIE